MSNNTKSGFEIRADLLSQAQGILEGNIQREENSVYSHNEVHPENKKVIKAHSVTTSERLKSGIFAAVVKNSTFGSWLIENLN